MSEKYEIYSNIFIFHCESILFSQKPADTSKTAVPYHDCRERPHTAVRVCRRPRDRRQDDGRFITGNPPHAISCGAPGGSRCCCCGCRDCCCYDSTRGNSAHCCSSCRHGSRGWSPSADTLIYQWIQLLLKPRQRA